MKKTILMIVAALTFAACGNNRGGQQPSDSETQIEVAAGDSLAVADTLGADAWENLPEEPVLDMKTSLGTITLKLYSKTPKHRDNFVKLAREHYYDSLLFHRVIPGFMIQGGDPDSRHPEEGRHYGSGGPGYTIPAEFVKEYYHKKGALAAARMGDVANPYRESSGSQFYLVQDEQACLHLDDQYTVFGETVQGLDVIDRIAAVETDPYDRPLKDVFILSIVPHND